MKPMAHMRHMPFHYYLVIFTHLFSSTFACPAINPPWPGIMTGRADVQHDPHASYKADDEHFD
jgi:hypothetical protein